MKLLRSLLAFTLMSFVSVHALAQEHATKDEAKALSNQAVAHIKAVGAEKAFQDFNTDKATWNKKDLYVYVMTLKGVMLAHGANEKLIGKSLVELKDQNGKLFVQEMMGIANSKGSGWVEYDWQHPQTKKIEGKESYALRIPDYDGFVVVGVYR